MIVLTVVLTLLGVVIAAVGAAGIAGILPGNSVIGLRIPEVRESKEMWIMGHKIAGPAWVGAGLALVGAAMVSMRATGFMWAIVAMLGVGSLVLLGMGAGLAAHTLAQIDAKRKAAEAASDDCCSTEGGCSCGDSSASSAAEAPAADSCCSDSGATGAANGQPTAAECASGQACGSCSLNGACEGGGAAFDAAHTGQSHAPAAVPNLDAARKAAVAQDNR